MKTFFKMKINSSFSYYFKEVKNLYLLYFGQFYTKRCFVLNITFKCDIADDDNNIFLSIEFKEDHQNIYFHNSKGSSMYF